VIENNKYLKNLPGLLIFEAEGDQFCIDVKDVQSIIKINGIKYKIEHSSNMHPVIIYSDIEYFLFDIRLVLDKHEITDLLGKKFILCTFFGKKIGLIVDEIIEFLSLDSIFIQKHVDFVEAENYKLMKWRLEYHNKVIFYPDYEKIAKEISTQTFTHPVLS
jgi:chemotaxis signal transduction protein